jgi:TrpR-related protein YerC/YecD
MGIPCPGLTNVITRYYISGVKQRIEPLPETDANASFRALAKALASLDKADEVAAFLRDLCTPAELEAMADRWRVVPLLLQGLPYREIHDRTLVSVTTIGRVARTLEHGAGGYAAAVKRQFPRLAPRH